VTSSFCSLIKGPLFRISSLRAIEINQLGSTIESIGEVNLEIQIIIVYGGAVDGGVVEFLEPSRNEVPGGVNGGGGRWGGRMKCGTSSPRSVPPKKKKRDGASCDLTKVLESSSLSEGYSVGARVSRVQRGERELTK